MGVQHIKVTGLVTGVVKYSDKNNILSLYTPTHGKISLLSGISGTKGGKLRNARLLPLSLIETELKPDRNKEIQVLRKVQLVKAWNGIYGNPQKLVTATFLTEFLNRLLSDYPPDAVIWEAILNGLERFDSEESATADFHIHFLASLLRGAGIMPDTTGYRPDAIFDMRSGTYTKETPLHSDVLSGEETMLPLHFADACMEGNEIHRWGCGKNRNRALDVLLKYFSIHFPGLDNLKSLDVVREVFKA